MIINTLDIKCGLNLPAQLFHRETCHINTPNRACSLTEAAPFTLGGIDTHQFDRLAILVPVYFDKLNGMIWTDINT